METKLAKLFIALLLIVGVGAAGYSVVHAYNKAIENAAEAKRDLDDSRDAIALWESVSQSQVRDRDAAALALEVKEKERAQAARDLALFVEAYRNAMAKLPAAERDCAGRRMPAAVDRLLAPKAAKAR
jgi:hypothetical protein